jgi:hypothetical protein
MVIEQIAESEPSPQLEQRAELVADHVGAALVECSPARPDFRLSLWKLIGKG